MKWCKIIGNESGKKGLGWGWIVDQFLTCFTWHSSGTNISTKETSSQTSGKHRPYKKKITFFFFLFVLLWRSKVIIIRVVIFFKFFNLRRLRIASNNAARANDYQGDEYPPAHPHLQQKDISDLVRRNTLDLTSLGTGTNKKLKRNKTKYKWN